MTSATESQAILLTQMWEQLGKILSCFTNAVFQPLFITASI